MKVTGNNSVFVMPELRVLNLIVQYFNHLALLGVHRPKSEDISSQCIDSQEKDERETTLITCMCSCNNAELSPMDIYDLKLEWF